MKRNVYLAVLCSLFMMLATAVRADVTPTVSSASEVSYFLEAPAGTYYVWPYDNSGNGGDKYTNAGWPGATMTDKGTMSNGRHLYKWTCSVNIGTPTNVIISKNSDTKLVETAASNHTYFLSTNGTSASAQYVVGASAPANSHSQYGHRVIYELNVGSFTSAGTFNAAKDRLQYLKDLGIDVIWLMPIYPRGGGINSPYAATDFTKTNPSYGSVSDLKSFVDAAHGKGMDVILDWVPNHVATNNVWASSHPEYINKNSDGSFKHPNGYGDVIELNYNTVGNEMTRILKDWMDKAGVDGFRFDYISSPTIPNSYWQSMSRELRAKKSSVILLGEGDLTNSSITKSCFDYDYAWGFNDDMRRFGIGNTNFSTFKDKVQNYLNKLSGFDISRMLYLSNHDNNWNGDGVTSKKSMKDIYGNYRYALTVMEFTLPGMPLVYNGQELDGTMVLNYFEDTKIDWNKTDANMTNLIKALAKMKHNYAALGDGNNPSLRGQTNFITASTGNVLAYERVQGSDRVLVIMNLSGSDLSNVSFSSLTNGTWTRVIAGSPTSCNTDASSTLTASGNKLTLSTLPAYSYRIYRLGGTQSTVTPSQPETPSNPGNNNSNTGNTGGTTTTTTYPGVPAKMYFVTEDSWNANTKHEMKKVGEDNDYSYFQYTIKRNDFDALQESSKPKLYVKVPADWNAAAVYAWNGNGNVKEAWPGVVGTKNGDYYEFNLADEYYKSGINFIVNNNNGGKQIDVNVSLTDTSLGGVYVDVASTSSYTTRTEGNPLYFKFREYNADGTTRFADFYGAGSNTSTAFTANGQKDYTGKVSEGGNAFTMNKPTEAQGEINILLLASKKDTQVGKVKVYYGAVTDAIPQLSTAKVPAKMYFVTEDSWNANTKHEMTKTGSDNDYTYFQYTIKRADFDALQESSKPKLYVKVPSGWNAAAVYAWSGNGNVKEAWPGVVGTKNGDYYEFNLADEYYKSGINFIVNNNNGGKQIDVNISLTDTSLSGVYVDVASTSSYSTRTEENPLYFKFREYNADGTPTFADFYGAGSNSSTAFTNNAEQKDYTGKESAGGNAFTITKPTAAEGEVNIVLMASKKDTQVGKVKVYYGAVTNGGVTSRSKAGAVTEIENVEVEPAAPAAPQGIYDLRGRKMNPNDRLAPGIYIVNGKKCVIR